MAWSITSGPTDFTLSVPESTQTSQSGVMGIRHAYTLRGWTYVLTLGAQTITTYVVVKDEIGGFPLVSLADKGLALVTSHLSDPVPPGRILLNDGNIVTTPPAATDPLPPG